MNGDLQVLTVIKTRLLRRGSGVEADDPIRIIEQWWDMDGRLLFQVDTWNGEVEHGLGGDRTFKFSSDIESDGQRWR